MFGNFPFDSSIFKQLKAQERVRNFDHSDSDVTEDEYQLPPQPWHVNRENDRDIFGPQTMKVNHKYLLSSVTMKMNPNGKDLVILMLGMANNGNCLTRRSQIP